MKAFLILLVIQRNRVQHIKYQHFVGPSLKATATGHLNRAAESYVRARIHRLITKKRLYNIHYADLDSMGCVTIQTRG